MNWSIWFIRSRASWGQLGSHYFLFLGFILVNKSSIYLPKSVWSDFRSVIDGGPVQVITLYIWFNVELPGNIGFPEIIYPSIHPKLHTSAGCAYLRDPSNIYGALYHLVAIYYVNIGGNYDS